MPPCMEDMHYHPGVQRCHQTDILHQKSKIAHGTRSKPMGKIAAKKGEYNA